MNTWLKIEQESSGYPADVITPEQKQQYIANYKGHENIDLDPEMVKKNPGRKATTKLGQVWRKSEQTDHAIHYLARVIISFRIRPLATHSPNTHLQ